MARRGRGEGTVYRRADGRWEAAFGFGGRRQRYVGRSQREVRIKLLAAHRALEQGIVLSGSSQRVEEYLTRWLEDSVRPSVRWTTHRAYALCMRRLFPLIGHLRMAALTPQAVQAAYAALLTKGLSRRSVEQTHTVLHRALRQAVLWGLMLRNPTEAVTVPRPARREMHTLTEEEVGRLFRASQGHRLHALWVLLATTGLRLGEALGLLWSDIDVAHGRLVVNRALQRQPGVGYVFVEPKTARSRRTVYLAAGTVTALMEHRRRQVEDQLAAGPDWNNTGLVFASPVGRPVDGTWTTKWFHRALDQGGLPRIRIHDLRHTAATHLLNRGVHPKVVQELLGHSTISLTLDTYSHVAPALHAEVAAHMQTLFE
jgi:integrase